MNLIERAVKRSIARAPAWKCHCVPSQTMKSQPKLLRIITPPPVAPSNVIVGEDLKSVTHKALNLHLSKTFPISTPRTIPFKIQVVTVHPSQPFVAYLLVPEGSLILLDSR